MKGKKIDKEFVSEFISSCISKNINTPRDIVNCANEAINKINNEIKYIEKQKIIRSKLLDVVSSFNIENSKSDNSEAESLKFFNLKDQKNCQLICKNIKSGISIKDLNNKKLMPKEDLLFSIKQLIGLNVLVYLEDRLIAGSCFNEYIRAIL